MISYPLPIYFVLYYKGFISVTFRLRFATLSECTYRYKHIHYIHLLHSSEEEMYRRYGFVIKKVLAVEKHAVSICLPGGGFIVS